MNKELQQCGYVQKPLTITECIDRLETLFKAYQKDNEFNYQLEVSNSPFNTLKQYARALEIIKRGFRDDGKYGENFDYIDLEEGYLCIDGSMYLYDGECDLLKEVLCSNSADNDLINNTFGLD